MKRCDWATQYDIYLPYHDEEWGVPVYDEQRLFEFLILESMQAGLSWRLILERRPFLMKHFDNFQPEKIARYSETKYQRLLNTPEIIRNRAKIKATIHNAKRLLNLRDNGQSFSQLLWSIVDGQPIVNHYKQQSQVPASNHLSDAMTKLLKQHGFKFVGTTICYSFMQAVGMVNDHLISCFRHKEV